MITSENARGDSPAVTLEEYKRHVNHGLVLLREIATACESLGGAYDFATGNGVFHFHVRDN